MENTELLRAPSMSRCVEALPSLCGEAAALIAKQTRACVFAGSFFAVLALSRHLPLGPLPRYDFLLLAALAMQAMLLWLKVETFDELKTIGLFHVTGLALEIFKTHPAIASWSYPEFAYSKIFGAPLYSGFMHAAVASYLVQAWRLFDLRLMNYPNPLWTLLLAAAIYVNFFSHHYIGDLRWWLFAALLLVFGRTRLSFTPWRRTFWLPLPLCFLLIGAFVWIAENIGTFYGAWAYPDQQSGWKLVHWGKISSWTLLVVITFVIVADLKHLKLRRQRQA